MKSIRDLEINELRVLGALLEKEQTTPDYYPLTVNALLAACNQKSNRDPVTSLSEGEVLDVLDSLRVDVLVWRGEGARVERWSQSISRRLELDPEEKALLTLLMLRGPQTPGQLRSRSGRLHAFEGLAEIEAALERMTLEGRELVAELPRRPGQKENRWTHLLSSTAEDALAESSRLAPQPDQQPDPRTQRPALSERVASLEGTVAELAEVVKRLRQQIEAGESAEDA